MRVALCLLSLLGVCLASDVVTLTSGSFNKTLTEKTLTLVSFLSPGCESCKRLEAEMETAATLLKAHNPEVAIAKVNCEKEKLLCSRARIRKLPTLKVFRALKNIPKSLHPESLLRCGMSREFTADGLVQLAADVLSNRERDCLRSGIPKIQHVNGFETEKLVATEFDAFVNNPKADVLIAFFAPKMPGTKRVLQQVEEVALKMEYLDSINVGSMDVSRNDVPFVYDVRQLPAIYLAPMSGKNAPIRYMDEFANMTMIRWVAKTATFANERRNL